MENPVKNFASNSLKKFDEKAKNFLKNSTKKVLETLAIIKGAKYTELKNILHTKNRSFGIHMVAKQSSKKLSTEIETSKKKSTLLNRMYILLTPKNLNNLKE